MEADASSLAAHLTQEQRQAVAFLAEFAKRMVVFCLAERRTPAEVSSVVRQISCRIYHSLDVSDCEAPLDDDGRCINVRDDICGLGAGIAEGLTMGLSALELQPHQLELTAGLRMALDEPALAEQWLVGKPAFSEAEIADARRLDQFL